MSYACYHSCMDAYHVLVIILSTLLAVFLVLAIIVAVLIIALVKKIEKAVNRAQQAAANVQAITGSVRNVADGSALASIALKVWEKVNATRKDSQRSKRNKEV